MFRQREIKCGNCGNKYDDCYIVTDRCPICCSGKNQVPQ